VLDWLTFSKEAGQMGVQARKMGKIKVTNPNEVI